jgi:hypothetical protein
MPTYETKSVSVQRSHWILGALAAAFWIAPASAQTASSAGGATSGSEPDRAGQATAEPDSQTTAGAGSTTAASGTGSGGERDRTAVKDSQTTAGTGSTSEASGTTTTAKDQVRSILDEDPGRWPYAGRSSSDRGH